MIFFVTIPPGFGCFIFLEFQIEVGFSPPGSTEKRAAIGRRYGCQKRKRNRETHETERQAILAAAAAAAAIALSLSIFTSACRYA